MVIPGSFCKFTMKQVGITFFMSNQVVLLENEIVTQHMQFLSILTLPGS